MLELSARVRKVLQGDPKLVSKSPGSWLVSVRVWMEAVLPLLVESGLGLDTRVH